MKLLTEGSAWLRSKSDVRWDVTIYNCNVGGFVMPSELEIEIEKLKKLYGEPPEDLEWEYHKY